MKTGRVTKPRYCVVLYVTDRQVSLVTENVIRADRLEKHGHYILDYTDAKSQAVTQHDVHLWTVVPHSPSGFKSSKSDQLYLEKLIRYQLLPRGPDCIFCALQKELESSQRSLEQFFKTAIATKRKVLKRARVADSMPIESSKSPVAPSHSAPSAAHVINAANLDSECDSQSPSPRRKKRAISSQRDLTFSFPDTDNPQDISSQLSRLSDISQRIEVSVTEFRHSILAAQKFAEVFREQSSAVLAACTALRRCVADFTQATDKWGTTLSAVFDLNLKIARNVEATNRTIHERKTKSDQRTSSLSTDLEMRTPPQIQQNQLFTSQPSTSAATTSFTVSEQDMPGSTPTGYETSTENPDNSEQDAVYRAALLNDATGRTVSSLRENTAACREMHSSPGQMVINCDPRITLDTQIYKKLLKSFKTPQQFFLQLLRQVMVVDNGIDVRQYTYSGSGCDKHSLFKNPLFQAVLRQMMKQYPDYKLTPNNKKSLTDWCARQKMPEALN